MSASLSTSAGALAALLLPDASTRWIGTVALLSLRVAAIFLLTPVFYAAPLPASVRALLLLGLSLCLAASLPATPTAWTGWAGFVQSAATELALGATLGLGILLAFASFSVAGQLLDIQIGFGIAQVLDPVTKRPVPILTSAFQYLAVAVFFTVNGHHALLRGLAYSLTHFPVGERWSIAMAMAPLLKQVTALFALGFALAAPVAFCILLVEFALGVVARTLPQMNMFAMGIPVKILVGLAALSLWFAGVGSVMTRVYGSIAITWDAIFVQVPAARAEQGAVR